MTWRGWVCFVVVLLFYIFAIYSVSKADELQQVFCAKTKPVDYVVITGDLSVEDTVKNVYMINLDSGYYVLCTSKGIQRYSVSYVVCLRPVE